MKSLLIILGLLLFLTSSVLASEYVPDTPIEQLSYIFRLYHDNGQLVADRDFEFKYDVIPETFVPETINTQFPFRGEIINLNNQVAGIFQFDPRRGDPTFLKGKISVKAPYVADGQKAVFYDAQDNQLLAIFVQDSSFCNDDGVCNANNGEDQTTCPLDCKSLPVPVASPETSVGGQNSMLTVLIYVLIIAGAGLGGWYGWKWWKIRKESPLIEVPTNLPPPMPPSV